jgi:hypothetical protein
VAIPFAKFLRQSWHTVILVVLLLKGMEEFIKHVEQDSERVLLSRAVYPWVVPIKSSTSAVGWAGNESMIAGGVAVLANGAVAYGLPHWSISLCWHKTRAATGSIPLSG